MTIVSVLYICSRDHFRGVAKSSHQETIFSKYIFCEMQQKKNPRPFILFIITRFTPEKNTAFFHVQLSLKVYLLFFSIFFKSFFSFF